MAATRRPQRHARLKAGSMSRIDTLIAELCPDGVEYRKLGDAAEVRRGDRITKKDLIPNGKYGVVSGGMDFFGRYDSYNREANTITVAQYGSAGFVNYVEERFWANDVCYSVFPSSCLDNKFLYYAMEANQQLLYGMTTKAIPDHLPKDKLQSLQIPVPPIEVQREIVRILDAFAALTDELTAKLAEEVIARRQQYAYYRNRLLSRESLEALDGKPVEMVRLGDAARIGKGTYITQKQVVPGKIPVILGGTTPAYWHNKANHEGKAIVISRSGANAGFVSYWDEPIFVSDGFIVETDNGLMSRFLYHALKSVQNNIDALRRGSGVPHVNGKMLAAIEIPVPSLATQRKVVDILDRFDALTTSLTDGLPAEIEARCQQYEYYRDRLLDFPRKSVGIE